jgi:hypothetical protein
MKYDMTTLEAQANALSDGINTLAELLVVYADGMDHTDPFNTIQHLHGLSALLNITGAQLLEHCEAIGRLGVQLRTDHPG